MSAVGYDGGGPQTASGIGFKAQQELQLIQGRTATPLHGRPTTAGVADAADYSQPWAPAGRHRLASRARAAWSTFQPYWLITALSVFVAIFLYVDDRMNNIWVQRGLGLLTFTVLILCGFTMSSEQRRQLCFLVAFATCLELFSSQLWGVYRYRFGNVPLYIPPGHGIVFVMSALIARSPLVHAHPVAFKRAALSVSGGWSLAALTFLPHFTHRLDMEGALLWPIFALFVLGASS
ncbi:MAG TPA: hypothetical protein VE219_05955, partial [Candidatus Sulfotelmatobacter sp.]|nr:hypothetical protein [Candidatus Sulfotelmatobacter sp.]